ncbi:MAG: transglycosylase domain-containing protein [Thermomicrobiales bacterium]
MPRSSRQVWFVGRFDDHPATFARALYPDTVNPLDYSLMRKVREAFIAIALDKEFSKQDQMTMYLNLIFYGQRSHGIEAAAQTFFNKHASELDLAESSLLAGLPQAPSAYDPTVFFDQAKIRQQYVLNQMVKYDYITRAEADAAFAEPLTIQDQSRGGIQDAPHFTEYVKSWIVQNYGEDALYNSGLNFYTSIDVDLQAGPNRSSPTAWQPSGLQPKQRRGRRASFHGAARSSSVVGAPTSTIR